MEMSEAIGEAIIALQQRERIFLMRFHKYHEEADKDNADRCNIAIQKLSDIKYTS